MQLRTRRKIRRTRAHVTRTVSQTARVDYRLFIVPRPPRSVNHHCGTSVSFNRAKNRCSATEREREREREIRRGAPLNDPRIARHCRYDGFRTGNELGSTRGNDEARKAKPTSRLPIINDHSRDLISVTRYVTCRTRSSRSVDSRTSQWPLDRTELNSRDWRD